MAELGVAVSSQYEYTTFELTVSCCDLVIAIVEGAISETLGISTCKTWTRVRKKPHNPTKLQSVISIV